MAEETDRSQTILLLFRGNPQVLVVLGPARQRAPATSDGEPYNEDEAVQHEQISTEPMKAQSHGEYAGTEAYVVVNPVRRTAVMMQSWYMRAYPYTDVRQRIEILGHWIWFVLIDRRCPINRHAAQDEARRIGTFSQWLHRTSRWCLRTTSTPASDLRRAGSDSFLIELRGMRHEYSPR
ncbi:MAG: hypothetical protein WA718_02585 [Terriglobales bacterium]